MICAINTLWNLRVLHILWFPPCRSASVLHIGISTLLCDCFIWLHLFCISVLFSLLCQFIVQTHIFCVQSDLLRWTRRWLLDVVHEVMEPVLVMHVLSSLLSFVCFYRPADILPCHKLSFSFSLLHHPYACSFFFNKYSAHFAGSLLWLIRNIRCFSVLLNLYHARATIYDEVFLLWTIPHFN